MPDGRLNPDGIEERLVQPLQVPARKLPPTVVIPDGRLNSVGIEAKEEQPYQVEKRK
mgnify:CR=1 FL=1